MINTRVGYPTSGQISVSGLCRISRYPALHQFQISGNPFHPELRSYLDETPNGEVVNHLLDLLEVVLYGVEPLPQIVVLQVQHAESGLQRVQKFSDAKSKQYIYFDNMSYDLERHARYMRQYSFNL